MSDVKSMVSENKRVRFMHYVNGELWYKTECGFEFPVSTSDTGTGVFLAEDRAILFMRWINRHLKAIIAARASETETPTVE